MVIFMVWYCLRYQKIISGNIYTHYLFSSSRNMPLCLALCEINAKCLVFKISLVTVTDITLYLDFSHLLFHIIESAWWWEWMYWLWQSMSKVIHLSSASISASEIKIIIENKQLKWVSVIWNGHVNLTENIRKSY